MRRLREELDLGRLLAEADGQETEDSLSRRHRVPGTVTFAVAAVRARASAESGMWQRHLGALLIALAGGAGALCAAPRAAARRRRAGDSALAT